MSMVGDLVRQLDGLNQLRPSSSEEDEEEMAWPGVRSMSLSSLTFSFSFIRAYAHMGGWVDLGVCCLKLIYVFVYNYSTTIF